VLALAAALGAVQGGFITETLRGLFNPGQVTNAYSFSLRLPPGIYSAQLGVLSLLDPAQLLALLAELGPALLLAPPVTVYAWRSLRQGAWFEAAAGLTALLCFLFPLFFQYGVDRSITRLPGTALWLWVVLALPPLAKRLEDASGRWRGWAAALALALSAGGLAVFAVQLTTLPDPQPSYFINPADARIARLHWDQLAPDARVFDRLPYRAVTLFGRADTAHRTIYFALPEWEALLADPDPARLAQAGYDYVYLDQDWFRALPVADQDALSGGCVQQVGEPQTYDKGKQERWLVDISGCGK
jgi:hypothetical protein